MSSVTRFHCPVCENEIWFHNSDCLACGTALAYQPGRGFVPLEGVQPCGNRAVIGCNWVAMVPGDLCRSCCHTTVIPDLSLDGNDQRWARIEQAKRALFRLLIDIGLPLETPQGAPVPLFEFKGDLLRSGLGPHVLTGHENSVITLNIAEADGAERARLRAELNEPYRTLTGHMRHEVAHHYWDVLVAPTPDRLARIRASFGDERQDYGAALQQHYETGAPAGWEETFVSTYATAHPWEDFAETWAHFLHIISGLETACAYGLVPSTALANGSAAQMVGLPMEQMAGVWIDLCLALNAVNETMGHGSFYPFVLSPAVIDKLETVRQLIVAARDA